MSTEATFTIFALVAGVILPAAVLIALFFFL